MDHFIAMTPEELKANLVEAVQRRIKRHKSQSAAARAWGVPQPTVNWIANGKVERFSAIYMTRLLMLDGAAIKMWVV